MIEFEPGQSTAMSRVGLNLAPAHETISKRTAVGLHPTPGLLVRTVEPTSPADHAGLRCGDVLVSAGGCELRSRSQFDTILHETAPRPLELTALRGEGRIVIQLAL